MQVQSILSHWEGKGFPGRGTASCPFQHEACCLLVGRLHVPVATTHLLLGLSQRLR